MAQKNNSASGTSHTTAEMREWFEKNREAVENFEKANSSIITLRDVTQAASTKNIQTVNKEELKSMIKKIGSSEKKLRETARYLFYRSNIYFRIVYWYATMFNLDARIVTPNTKKCKTSKAMKDSFDETLDFLDILDNQGNMVEALINVFIQDVYYAIRYTDEDGTFYYPLDADECIIETRYETGDFGFALDITKWKTGKRRKMAEYLGSPFDEMFNEHEITGNKYIHVPDEYAFCLKWRTDDWQTVIPPLLPTFLQLAGLEDLVDIQAEADALSVYKLIYMPLKTMSNAKTSDAFEVTPAIAMKYFDRMIDGGAVPDNVGAAVIPGDELKTIDFSKTVDSDTNSVEQSSNQILQTAGGGAVINSNNITSTAAFTAWLKAETEFAISTILPQIDGYTQRMLKYQLGDKAANVKHLPISVYTQKDYAEQFLTACQYSFSYRLAYGTLIGVSEKETLALLTFENDVLKLQDRMKYPLTSSFTSSGGNTEDGYTSEVGQGRPSVDDDELSAEGSRSRERQ